MSGARERRALLAWLAYCEAHPHAWAVGTIEIPLASVGLTFDEVEALFDWPTLPEVRQAVEAWLGGQQ